MNNLSLSNDGLVKYGSSYFAKSDFVRLTQEKPNKLLPKVETAKRTAYLGSVLCGIRVSVFYRNHRFRWP